MDLTPFDRLSAHMRIHYPEIKVKFVRPHHKPGFMIFIRKRRNQQTETVLIDIRGVGYPSKINGKHVSTLRLWNEMIEHYSQHIEVLKVHKGDPTKIEWQGKVYHLDNKATYKHKRKGTMIRGGK